MYSILMVFYVLICFGLIVSVLLQSAKGEGLAGAFGGGGASGAVFGGRGAATFLSRATTVFAVMFMLMAVLMSFMGSGGAGVPGGPSAIQKAVNQPQQSAPATDIPGTETVNQGDVDLFDQTTTDPATGDATTPAQPADDQPAADTGQ